jgi:multicomponent Na+:H+ antiporter subunit E
MRPIRYRIVPGMAVFALWVLLALPVSLQELIVGLIVSTVITAVPLPGVSVYGEIRISLKRVWFAVIYLLVFLRAVVKSNLDVALRVLSPTLPINPGIVQVKTALKSRIGRLLLANSITLTPGTITVAIEGEDIFVHWINTTADDLEESTRQIVSDFEKYLEVSFG